MSDKQYDEPLQKYSFGYMDCDGKKYEKTITTSGGTWMECVNDYIRFLESIFQYDIMNNVRLKEPVYLKMFLQENPSYLDPWTGEYFVEEEKEDEDTGNPGLTD